ncbi:MAG TPA: hypothetical protein VEK15_09795, partial [Vicinamibacteria bacterium]|nr:hypothetical protein [Vicinamibacteria bacterium]
MRTTDGNNHLRQIAEGSMLSSRRRIMDFLAASGLPRQIQRLVDWFRFGDISLGRYLLFSLAARIPASLFSRGYDFMDHQFQYVDPAYHLGLGGSWWRPHEYEHGLRSWIYPGLLAGIFRALAWLGIEAPVPMMVATRFVHALMGLLPLLALWMLFVRFRRLDGARPLLLFVAASPLTVYASVQPTGPTFATGLSLAAILLFEGPGRLSPFISGLLLGGAFCCRFQDAFFFPVLLAAGLLLRRYKASALMATGAAIVVTIQGLVDLWTWGSFLASPFRYVRWNVFEGAARRYGEEPLWFYLPLLALVLVLLPPFVRSGLRALAVGIRTFPLLFAASSFYLFLHSLVARKAFRFILPSLILLVVVCAFGLFQTSGTESRIRMAHRR